MTLSGARKETIGRQGGGGGGAGGAGGCHLDASCIGQIRLLAARFIVSGN